MYVFMFFLSLLFYGLSETADPRICRSNSDWLKEVIHVATLTLTLILTLTLTIFLTLTLNPALTLTLSDFFQPITIRSANPRMRSF